MPACRNCGARLTKFDKEVCPVCGTKNPLEGVTSDTVEMTSFINMEKNRDFRVKKKSTMLFYFFIAGFTGLPFFYLHAIKKGLVCIFLNICYFAMSFVLFGIVLNAGYAATSIITVFVMYFINSLVGILLYRNDSLKDGYGEFVR